MKNRRIRDSLVVGFALFAMFFGAGNLIFPAAIGASAGNQWPAALLATALAGIILPILALIGASNMGTDFQDVTKPVGNWYYYSIFFVLIVGIVMLANLPRTAATTHEIAIAPLFPKVPIQVTISLYFLIVLFLAFDRNNLVDKVGKFITPVLLIVLFIIIIKGFITPLGTPVNTGNDNIFGNTFTELYFTGDLFSGLMCAGIFLSALASKGYTSVKDRKKMILNAAVIAAVLFLFIYGGLLIFGAEAGSGYPENTERTTLLSGIVHQILGRAGTLSLSIIVTLACISTAVALVSVGANFFSELFKGKVSYRICAIFMCVISAGIAMMGVDSIISFAGPIFLAVYPSAIVLTFVSLFSKFLPNMGAYKYSVIVALAMGILDSMNAMGLSFAGKFLSIFPFASVGFAWIVPSLIGFIVGWLVYKFNPPPESTDTITPSQNN